VADDGRGTRSRPNHLLAHGAAAVAIGWTVITTAALAYLLARD
jgi:hypothetical protein